MTNKRRRSEFIKSGFLCYVSVLYEFILYLFLSHREFFSCFSKLYYRLEANKSSRKFRCVLVLEKIRSSNVVRTIFDEVIGKIFNRCLNRSFVDVKFYDFFVCLRRKQWKGKARLRYRKFCLTFHKAENFIVEFTFTSEVLFLISFRNQ